MKILVTYYSRTGTTRTVGEALAKELGADSDEIIDLRKRTGLWPIRWLTAGRHSMRKKLTEIKTGKSPKDYDLIAIGTPIWATKMTPAARTYLTNQKLDGKKVALFCTCGGDEASAALEEMKTLISKAKVVASVSFGRGDVKSGKYVEKVKSLAKSIRK